MNSTASGKFLLGLTKFVSILTRLNSRVHNPSNSHIFFNFPAVNRVDRNIWPYIHPLLFHMRIKKRAMRLFPSFHPIWRSVQPCLQCFAGNSAFVFVDLALIASSPQKTTVPPSRSGAHR